MMCVGVGVGGVVEKLDLPFFRVSVIASGARLCGGVRIGMSMAWYAWAMINVEWDDWDAVRSGIRRGRHGSAGRRTAADGG